MTITLAQATDETYQLYDEAQNLVIDNKGNLYKINPLTPEQLKQLITTGSIVID